MLKCNSCQWHLRHNATCRLVVLTWTILERSHWCKVNATLLVVGWWLMAFTDTRVAIAWTARFHPFRSPSYDLQGVLPYNVYRDTSVHAPSQWETTLYCNVVSHWLGAYTKWSLVYGFCYVNLRNGTNRNWQVVTVTSLSSPAVSKVVDITASSAASGDQIVTTATLPFQF